MNLSHPHTDSRSLPVVEPTNQPFKSNTQPDDGYLFIVIFKEEHENEINIFKTLVHGMVHAVQCQRKLKGTAHGKEYKKLGMAILEKMKANMSALPAPYSNVSLDEKEILSAKDSS